MKKKTIKIKPVGMVFKVEKKLAGGLAGTAIRGAVRSEPGRALFNNLKSKLKKMYKKGESTRSESDKKMLKGLFKVDLKRSKADILQDMMKFLYKSGRKAPKGSKGKINVGLFTIDSPKITPDSDLINVFEETKVDLDPNLNYSKIYKDNIQVDLGITSKGKARFRIKKSF